MKHFVCPAIALLLSLASCSPSADNDLSLKVDPANPLVLPFDTERLVRLETSDSSLIYGVDNMIIADGRYIIKSRDLLKSYSAADGSYLGAVARKGQGPGEFSMITRLWLDGDTVKFYDINNRRVTSCLTDGTFLGEAPFMPQGKASHPLTLVSFIETPDGSGYLGLNQFTDGTTPVNPQYSFFDNSLNLVGDVPGRELRSGAFAANFALADRASNTILAWENLCDTIFTVTPEGVSPAYVLDFGESAVPARIQSIPGYYDRWMAFDEARKKPGIRMAAFASNYQRGADGNYWFTFTTTDDGLWHLARFAPEGGKAEVYDFDFGHRDYALAPFILADGDDLITVFTDKSDPEANPMIYRHPLAK